MSYILTIVIPSYNISKFVDSIFPSYIDNNLLGRLKILSIDDGATDDTFKKVTKYVDKYPNLFYFIHKENGGHGSVINYALDKLIDTKYFMVIDGDDWVYTKSLCNLVNYLENCDDDLIITNCSYEFKNHHTISYGIRKNGDLNLRIHNVTFKTSIFRDNSISVREGVFYEDSQYVLFPLEYVKKYSYFNEVVARYRQDDPNQSVNPLVQLKRKNHYETVLIDLLNYFNKISNNNEIDEKIISFIISSITRIMYGSFELNWSYSRNIKEAIIDCRKINQLYKKYPLIYKNMKHKYKRFNQMKFLNFNGIRIARLLHKKR